MTKRTILVGLVGCALLGGACSKSANDAHYAAVESNREAQAAQPASAAAVASPSPSASVAASPGASSTAPAPASNYWTNFRGPKRDGKYDETTISTNWPSSGLPVVWKQPVGVGHASFVVAD